jgi:hypothetical protein
MRVEIRCCCDPGRLLGTVEVDVPYLYEGQAIRFYARRAISLKPWWEQRDGDLFVEHLPERLELPVARVEGYARGSGEYLNGLAVKSNDTPIETLRRIAGFQEAR